MARPFKAPQYFVDLMEEKEQSKKIAADMLGVSVEYLEKHGASALAQELAELHNQRKEELLQVLESGSICSDYAWLRFRYEKMKEGRYFKVLSYDPDSQVIREKTIASQISKVARDFMKLLSDVIGAQ